MRSGYKNMRCGLIGEHLGHSFSPLIHSELADYSYELCELPREELGSFMKSGQFDAFNVTIPYKKDVIPYLDSISPEALEIGAVNTVVRDSDGKLHGYNTDYFGFSHMIELSGVDMLGKKAIVIGAGGASLTVCAVLRDKGVSKITVISRKDNTPENLAKYSDTEIIVNATPVGMYPNNGISPLSLSLFPSCECVLDLICNPALTQLLIEAEARKITYVNGLPMLVAQAAKAFEFFTKDKCEDGCIESITSFVSQKTKNIVLVGMPGCGKSTIGALLARKLDKPFIDADTEFEKMHGITPANCIETMGEDAFRELEHKTTLELGKRSGYVIAMGGGVVTREKNYFPLHQNGTIFFIERDLDTLARDGRPISAKISPYKLYNMRIDAYHKFADEIVYNNETPERTANDIISCLKVMEK